MSEASPPVRTSPGEDPAVEFGNLWRLGQHPDVQQYLQQAGPLTPAQVVAILSIDQWERWHQGERIPAEAHLQMHPALQPELVEGFDLVFGEFLLREELGEDPRLAEYLERFPQYATQLEKQYELHRAIESGSLFGASAEPGASLSALSLGGSPGTSPARGEAEWPTIPGYEILGELGCGGMGRVFKAVHQRLHRTVALKVIRPDRLSQNQEAIRRFRREARAAAQLSHPNVVVVFDTDQVGDVCYIAMEYVEGTDLWELVKEIGPLPIDQACDYIRQAAQGLQHAFERGLVHRDIKPSNLLVTMPRTGKPKGLSGFHVLPNLPGKPSPTPTETGAPPVRPVGLSYMGVGELGVVKILDMGLALLVTGGGTESAHTVEGTLMGTPDFIAPEQALNSHTVDIRADLYSLGCTFYYLLTGRPPFGDHPLIKKLMMHQLADPPPVEQLRPQVPPVVRRIVATLLEKRPEKRFQTPADLIHALKEVVILTPPPPPTKAAPPVKLTPSVAPPPPEVPTPPPQPQPTVPESAAPDSTPSLSSDAETQAGPEKAKKIVVLEGHRGWVTSVAFSLDRGTLASGGVDGALRLWDLAGTEPRDQAVADAHPSDILSLAFAPDKRTLATGSGTFDGIVRLWDYSGPEPTPRASLRHPATVDALAFSPDGKMLACAGSDKHVRLFDISAEPQARNPLKGHTDFVKTLMFSRDGKLLATGGKDGTVRLWNWSRFWSKEQAVLQGHGGQVQTLAFSHDDKTLAFGCLDQTVRLWDLSRDRPYEYAVLHGHEGVLRLVQFNPQAKTLVSICDAGLVILWDITDGKQLRDWLLPRGKIYSVALTHDGRYLATGNSDGSVFLFRLYPQTAESVNAAK